MLRWLETCPRAVVRAEVSAVRVAEGAAAGEVCNQLIQCGEGSGGSAEDVGTGEVDLDLLAAGSLNALQAGVAVVGGGGGSGGGVEGEGLDGALASAEEVLSLIAGVGKREDLVADSAELLGDGGEVGGVERAAVSLYGEGEGRGELLDDFAEGGVGDLQEGGFVGGGLDVAVVFGDGAGHEGALGYGDGVVLERGDAQAARIIRWSAWFRWRWIDRRLPQD